MEPGKPNMDSTCISVQVCYTLDFRSICSVDVPELGVLVNAAYTFHVCQKDCGDIFILHIGYFWLISKRQLLAKFSLDDILIDRTTAWTGDL